MLGPGIYDDICSAVREKHRAEACILIVMGGNRGTGFSVQAPIEVTFDLPRILRRVANEIEADFERGQL